MTDTIRKLDQATQEILSLKKPRMMIIIMDEDHLFHVTLTEFGEVIYTTKNPSLYWAIMRVFFASGLPIKGYAGIFTDTDFLKKLFTWKKE